MLVHHRLEFQNASIPENYCTEPAIDEVEKLAGDGASGLTTSGFRDLVGELIRDPKPDKSGMANSEN